MSACHSIMSVCHSRYVCLSFNYVRLSFNYVFLSFDFVITKRGGIITNCDSLVYYKAQWTLQIATACLLQIATRITKCDDYYKLSTLGGNWRGSYSWGYKEYNAITMHASLS